MIKVWYIISVNYSKKEDLSLQYRYPDKYKKIEGIKLKIEDDRRNCLQEMLSTINNILTDKSISMK